MRKLIVSLAFSSVLAAGLAVAQGEGESATGVSSAQCLAYANTTGGTMTGGTMTGGTMTGGTMTGGTMTGGTMTGGAGVSTEQAQNAIQSAVACLNELQAEIVETNRRRAQAVQAILAIRNDLGRALLASEYVQESEATLAQLELLQQQVRDEQAEAANTLEELVESLNNLPGGGN